MNRNEFENWMKDKLQEQQFPPGEDLWQKLNSDLQKPAGHEKKAILLSFLKLPVVKIAASAALILSLGIAGSYLFKSNQTHNTPDVAVEKPTESAQLKTNIDTDHTSETTPTATASNAKEIKANAVPQRHIRDTQAQQKAPSVFNEDIIQPQIAHTPNKEEQPVTPQAKKNEDQYQNTQKYKQPLPGNPDNNYYAQHSDDKKIQAVNIGMAANIGRSTISNVAYQVGVVGRGNISSRIFVEAGISLASNTVNNSSVHSFPGVELGSDGFSNTENKTTNRVQADYSRNIISLGVTPSVGFKVTRRLSVSTGGAIYRNLNPSLELTNGDRIESAALKKDIISTSQKVTEWDLGLTCNADYKVTRNLSFNVNYRKGLTDYLQTDKKFIKNSGVQVGVKYLFGK